MTFAVTSALESLPIENWDVSSATTMSQMFFQASALKKLDFSKWNTPKVTNFHGMLYMQNSGSSLETVDLSGLGHY
jgi:bacterial surface protein 26-residue repeat